MKIGWIKLYRQIQESDFWLNDEPFDRRSAWIDLLMMANYENKTMIFDGNRVEIKRGQVLTSVRKLAHRWGWSPRRTLHYLRLLEECDMVTRDSNSRRTLLTIVKYDDYQICQNTNDNSSDNSNVHTNDNSSDNTNDNTNDNTHDNTNDPQLKNIKNIKNIRNIFIAPSVDDVRAYCQERKNNVNPESFVNFYESKGWLVGKNKMKDWKAAVRTWEQKEKKPKNKFNNFDQRNYDYNNLERMLLNSNP